MPDFAVVYAGREPAKLPSGYLANPAWIGALDSVIKGIKSILISGELKEKADNLALAMGPRRVNNVCILGCY